ncbi:MAG: DUF2298 domain-containing protein [Halodesulfurarchaeum sp.]
MTLGVIVVWLALFLGLSLLALPAASGLFRDFADRGAGLAVPLAFAVIALLAYWIGRIRFGLVAALLAVVGLGALSLWALRRGVSIDRRRYRDAAVVFTLAYLLLIGIRLFRPGAYPGGGEKFLDFGLLASLLRATSLPPMDPWFAGETVQYYYGGHMLAAVFAELTATPARFAYNTALAGYFAAYVTAAWGLAGNLAARLDRPYRVGGALGAVFVGLAGNLSTPVRFLAGILPGEAGTALARAFGLEITGLAEGPMAFHYWDASRVIHADPAGESQLITEFPFFAFLNGDLHGHMMSPTFLLLGAAFAFAYWVRPAADRRGRWLRLLAVAPIGGLLVITNTWSAPAVFGLTALALYFGPAPPWTLFPEVLRRRMETWTDGRPIAADGTRLGLAILLTAGIAVLGALTVFPFLTGAASGRSIGVLPTPRSNLGGLVLVWGAFLGITAGYLAARASRKRWWGVAVGIAGLVVLTAAVRATALALFVPPLLGGWYLLRAREDLGFETVLAIGALGLLVLIEFIYVVEQAGPGRMNTVFKIGAQAWAIWAVSGGAMAAWLVGPDGPRKPLADAVSRARHRLENWGEPIRTVSGSSKRQRLAAMVLAGLLVGLLIYPVFGTAWAVGSSSGEPTLDARAYVATDHPEEVDAIAWLANRDGQPTMVSAPGTEIYRWVNGPSSLTGVPTVAGWVHEVGYRGQDPYWDRVRDVEIIYETAEHRSRMALLEKYDVTYVYVGPIERSRYDPPDLAREPSITTAYADEHVTIYRVRT